MNCCYIVGPMDFNFSAFDKRAGDLIIAADAGYLNLKNNNIKPDYLIGDFDSLSELPDFKNIISYPTEKDDTDLLLSVKKALDLGFKKIKIYGALGGRIDHSIANLQILRYIKENNAQGYIVGMNEVITVIENEKIIFDKSCTGTISIFALSKQAVGVDIENLKYEIRNKTLEYSFPIGVSNEFTGKEAKIAVKDGSLILVFPTDADFIIKNWKYLHKRFIYGKFV